MSGEEDMVGIQHDAMKETMEHLVDIQAELDKKLLTGPAVGEKRSAQQRRMDYLQFRSDPLYRASVIAFEQRKVPQGMISRRLVESILQGERDLAALKDGGEG